MLFLVSILLLLLSSKVAANDAVIEWLRSNGGTVSEKVQFIHLDPNDASSPVGIFAKDELKKGETIMVIPQKCLFTTPPPQSMCETARALAQQVREGGKSFFKEWVNYVFDGNKHKKVPYRWSDDAKQILREITGNEFHVSVGEELSFNSICGDGGDLEADAWESVITRSWGDVMIPVYDMVNHRNGRWRNFEGTSAHTGDDVSTYAYRDIKAGEQLYLSYNECDDDDCEGIFRHYGTQEILVDYGFVEDFPQRWIFNDGFPFLEQMSEPLIIEVDQVEKPDPYDPSLTRLQYDVTWNTKVRLTLDVQNFITSQVNRLEKLESDMLTATESLESSHEQYTIRKYYESLKRVLKLTLLSSYDKAIDALADADEEDRDRHDNTEALESSYELYTIQAFYVSLKRALTLAMWPSYDEAINETALVDSEDGGRHYDTLDERSLFGRMEKRHPPTCHPSYELGTAGHYKSHFSVFSHYQHIEFLHVEEQNDTCLRLSNWLQTCTSFRQYNEALVHYPASFLSDIRRVAYIGGGDNMILHEILKYPSIELVIGLEHDQQVVRSAFLNMGTLPYFDDPRIQWWFGDAAKSVLMLPQEYIGSFDLVFIDQRTNIAEVQLVTDSLSIMDTAKLLVKESTGIIAKNNDFPVRGVNDFARYSVVMEYCDMPQICRQSISIGSNKINFLNAPQYKHEIPRIYMNKTLEESGRFTHWYEFRNDFAGLNNTQEVLEELAVSGTKWSAASHGILLVIEAEELDGSVKDKTAFIVALTEVLAAEGIEVLSVDQRDASFDFVLVLREGYVVIRKFSQIDDYMAIDIVLWGAIDKSNLLKSRILSTAGGNENKSTSFRLVMGGIEGGNPIQFLSTIVPIEESCDSPDTSSQEKNTTTDDDVWKELLTLIPDVSNSSLLVLCGSKDSPCSSFDSLKPEMVDTVLPIYTCSDLIPSNETTFFMCEVEIMKSLTSSGVKTLSGIVLDVGATLSMSRVLLRLISGFFSRSIGILSEKSYAVVAEMNNDAWRAIFVERFRIEISPFAPSAEARLVFGSQREYALFSSGVSDFYAKLASFEMRLNAESQGKVIVNSVTSGYAAYVPDFDPPFLTNADFENPRAFKQYNGQRPIGMQVLFQFELQELKTSLALNELVLWQHDTLFDTGDWIPARVVGLNNNMTYHIRTESYRVARSVRRGLLRRLDFDADAPPLLDFRAKVLVLIVERDCWQQGSVLSRLEDGTSYEVRLYTGEELVVENIGQLMPLMETNDENNLPNVSMVTFSNAFSDSLKSVIPEEDLASLKQHEHAIQKGMTITAFWKGGNAILVWSGERRVDINLFLHQVDEKSESKFYDSFVDKLPFMETLARDRQPRGFGGVVNFGHEIHDKTPIWWKGVDKADF